MSPVVRWTLRWPFNDPSPIFGNFDAFCAPSPSRRPFLSLRHRNFCSLPLLILTPTSYPTPIVFFTPAKNSNIVGADSIFYSDVTMVILFKCELNLSTVLVCFVYRFRAARSSSFSVFLCSWLYKKNIEIRDRNRMNGFFLGSCTYCLDWFYSNETISQNTTNTTQQKQISKLFMRKIIMIWRVWSLTTECLVEESANGKVGV